MDKIQSQFYGMVSGLIIYLDEPSSISVYSGQAIFAAQVPESKTIKLEIEGYDSIQQQSITWARTEKLRLKSEMTTLALNVANRTYAYGLVATVTEITGELKLSRSDIMRLSDKSAAGQVDRVIVLATKYLSHLAPYNVTQNEIDDLEAAKTTYINFQGQPKKTIGEVADATLAMKDAFKRLRKVIATMDGLVNIFEAAHPEFVRQYWILRRIYDEPTNTMALRVTVLDQETKLPIEGVNAFIPDPGISRITSINGVFEVQNLSEGDHSIDLDHPEYNPLTFIVTIVNGQFKEETIEMVHK
jgi:hypothetical protein